MTDLHDTIDTHLRAYGEPDPARRAALIELVWGDGGRLVDPPIEAAGRDGVSEMAAAVQSHYPGHTFLRTSGIDAHHGFARYEWSLLDPDGAAVLTGLDIAELGDDGRIRQIVGFLGPIPAGEG